MKFIFILLINQIYNVMAYELNRNTGTFFYNDKKENNKHPDFKGHLNVEGIIFDIGIWKKIGKQGKEYFFISLSESFNKDKEDVQTREKEKYIPDDYPRKEPNLHEEDDLPF